MNFYILKTTKRKTMYISVASIGLCPPQSERSQTQSSWGTFLTECALMGGYFSDSL